jgi:3-hydroxyisobutyrate dehydrogenase-like beta-hydroxyacid dehydrogenase
MGGGMIATLLKAEQQVWCFDPNDTVRIKMAALGATATDSATKLAQQCDVIILSLPTADIVQTVMNEIGRSPLVVGL